MRVVKIVHHGAFAVVIASLVAVLGATPCAAKEKEDYAKHPGYVDFNAMKIMGDMESSVEVFLKGALLTMATEAVKHDDPELSEVLAGLKLVQVQVFPLDDLKSTEVRGRTDELAKQLEKKGWEMVVRVREDDESVYLYLLPGEKAEIVHGLVVMAVEDDDEAVFVNIVGEINPVQIGRIGCALGLHDLEDIHININDDVKYERKSRTNRR